jgi:hypothetical protein
MARVLETLLAKALFRRLIGHAASAGFMRLTGETRASNAPVLHLARGGVLDQASAWRQRRVADYAKHRAAQLAGEAENRGGCGFSFGRLV